MTVTSKTTENRCRSMRPGTSVKGFDQALGSILLALLFTYMEYFFSFLFLHFEMVALVLFDHTVF